MKNQLRHRTACLLLFMAFSGPEMFHGQAPSARGDETLNKSSTPAVRPASGPKADEPWENSLGMKFVPVAGTAVLFGVWDVRVQDYQAFATATGRAWEKPRFAQGPTHPAVDVSWDDAQAFCHWLTEKERQAGKLGAGQSYRLPADWEWSVAVGLNEGRGGTPASRHWKSKAVYPWGAQWPPPRGAGNYGQELNGDDFAYTSPVGSFAANQFGLYDLGGNVWQWCEDFYDGSRDRRVLRGGSWCVGDSGGLLSSYRYDGTSDYRFIDVGFRCVLAGAGAAPASRGAVPVPTPQVLPPAPAVGTSPPAAAIGQPWENSLGMKFVPVAGTAVLFSVWDVRVQDYQAFATATGRAWEKPGFAQGPTHPAVKVSWDDAQAFCHWLTEKERQAGKLGAGQSYRLPADWEWSVAVGLNEARERTPKEKNSKIAKVYPWGTQWPPPRGAGNYDSSLKADDFEFTSLVGSFAANQFGLYDLGGNVWQWCEDFYDGSSGFRVLRGGSWDDYGSVRLLSSCRRSRTPDFRDYDFGFRCVLVGVSSR